MTTQQTLEILRSEAAAAGDLVQSGLWAWVLYRSWSELTDAEVEALTDADWHEHQDLGRAERECERVLAEAAASR